MEEGRKNRKRKTEKFVQVQWQKDLPWEGGDMHTEHGGKRKKKKKKKSEASEEASSRISILQDSSVPSSYTDPLLKQTRKEKMPKNVCLDHTVLKQKRKENKPKNVCRNHTPLKKQKRKGKKPENVLCRGEVLWPPNDGKSNSTSNFTEEAFEVKKKAKSVSHSLCKLKEQEQAQVDVNIDMHGDHSVSSEGNKPQHKKVRFSDQCLEDANIDVYGIYSASCEGNKPRWRKKVRFSDQCLEDANNDMHGDPSVYSEGNKPRCKVVRFSDQIPDCQCKQNVSQELCAHSSNVSKESFASGQDKCTPTCSFEGKIERENITNPSLNKKVLPSRKRQRDEDDEIWGKRFTPEEDEILKNAVQEYIKVKGWEVKEGIDKVLNCRKHKEAYNCWGAIRLSLPNRPRRAVRFRAYRLFQECTHSGPWSKEEIELLKRLHEMHGSQWKNLSTLMGRSQYSISGKWRILKRNPTGVWTWDEIQQLSDMVHKCLRVKALFGARNGKSSRNYYLRDNISWDKIADTIGTHNHGSCCTKWYSNLSSTMVVDGLWASEDDCLLLKRLLESGACTEEEVEWHRLLNHRSGQTCLFRWKQMVKHLGENRTRGFLEKLDSLVRRYVPELLYPR